MQRYLFDHVNVDPVADPLLDGAAADLDGGMRALREGDRRRPAGSTCRSSASAPTGTSASTSRPASSRRARTVHSEAGDAAEQRGAVRRRSRRGAAEALSMGMGTILHARRRCCWRRGSRRPACVERSCTGPITTTLPASFLQLHRDARDHARCSRGTKRLRLSHVALRASSSARSVGSMSSPIASRTSRRPSSAA